MLDFSKYINVANRYQRKAKYEDKEDLKHTIIVSLAQAQINLDNDSGGQLSDIAMFRIAAYECQKYWRAMKRQYNVFSLNAELNYGDGEGMELIDTIADDSALDLAAWIDAKTWLLGCPARLVQVASKRIRGILLEPKEKMYLQRFRRKEQQCFI